MKTCPKCKITKVLRDFAANRSTRDGLQYHCKTCVKGFDKSTREKPGYSAARRRRNLQHRYGIDQKTYDIMLAAQNGVCGICAGTDKCALAVDHNHNTGQVRGLLCTNCNTMIGHARESAANLRVAAHYLDRHKMRLEA